MRMDGWMDEDMAGLHHHYGDLGPDTKTDVLLVHWKHRRAEKNPDGETVSHQGGGSIICRTTNIFK